MPRYLWALASGLVLVVAPVDRPVVAGVRADQSASRVVSAAGVRAHMEMLAGDALRGRRAGSPELFVAATYAATELRRVGVEPMEGRRNLLTSFDMNVGSSDTGLVRGWNVVGRLAGRDPAYGAEVIVLSAHLDHIGARDEIGDAIFNGADDNASGVAAVLGLAAALAQGPRPRRTLVFALFDGEEAGGRGSAEFVARPPVPLDRIAAVVNFEMVGRPDRRLAPGTLWLTGYERTTLGPALADAGALVVADPYPEQRFFERSDNIRFARLGVVAQTLSSYDLHPDYHSPDDEVDRIDFDHLAGAIAMMVAPIRWLADSAFRPEWHPGGRPEPRGGR